MRPARVQPAATAGEVEVRVAADAGAPPLATARLRCAIGLDRPRVWYHVGCTVHMARELGLYHRQRTLLLGHDLTGASELAEIRWARDEQPLAAQAAALHALVDCALAHVAAHRRDYAERLIVELPGPRDSAGQSPFWAGLGRHFYGGDPRDAESAHGDAWRSHVAALLPRQPIYASFLTEPAQAAIGQTHAQALVLREVLEHFGLRYAHHVDVADGGPVLDGAIDDLLRVSPTTRDAATTRPSDTARP